MALRRPTVAAVLAATLALAAPVTAGPGEAGNLRVEAPWARATPPGTPVGAGYLEIVNEGDAADRLLGASTPAAARVQLHRSVERDGTTTMVHQPDGVTVPAGGRRRFSPGGYHLMLMGLTEPLEAGERVPLTLRFERAGAVDIELQVRPLDAGGS